MNRDGPIRLVLAEDNLLVREGLTALLRRWPGVALVAVVTSLPDLMLACECERPDLVMTDIRMPPQYTDEGIQAAVSLRRTNPEIAVIVVSAYASSHHATELFQHGTNGRGYLVKDRIDERDYLLQAIRTVSSGGSFVDDSVFDMLVQARSVGSAGATVNALSPREQEVLAQLATGRNNRAIAQALSMSVHAVEKHTGAIFAKLGLADEHNTNRRVRAVLRYLNEQPIASPAAVPSPV